MKIKEVITVSLVFCLASVNYAFAQSACCYCANDYYDKPAPSAEELLNIQNNVIGTQRDMFKKNIKNKVNQLKQHSVNKIEEAKVRLEDPPIRLLLKKK